MSLGFRACRVQGFLILRFRVSMLGLSRCKPEEIAHAHRDCAGSGFRNWAARRHSFLAFGFTESFVKS